MRLHEMQEKRSAIVAEMRAVTAEPAGEDGDLSAEQNKRFETLKGELAAVEKKIERQALIDEAERRAAGTPIHGTGDQRFDEALRGYSLRAALAGSAGLTVDWSRERELSAELAKRAGRPFQGLAVPMSVFHKPVEKRVITSDFGSPPVGGGNLIATDHLGNQFIDTLRAAMIVRRLGARILTGLVGNVDIPKLKTSATTAWVAENSAISNAEQDFDKVQLAPKHAGTIVELSRNMLQQSSPDIETLIRADFAEILAQAMDKAAIKGGGSNEPDGVLEQGIDVTVTMGSSPTWAKVLEIIERVQLDNAEGTAWATTPSVVRKLRSTAKVSSTDSVMIMQGRESLADYPLATTNNVPANLTDGGSPEALDRHALIFGNWSDLIVGYWSELDVLVNPFAATPFSKGNVQIRAMMTCDIAVRHAESFAACIDLDP